MKYRLTDAQYEIWKMIRNRKTEINGTQPTDKISGEEWIAHFSNMYNNEGNTENQNHHPIAQIHNDDETSKEELQRTIKILNNRKAQGLDGIVNEMQNDCEQPLEDQL